jgi:predicted O-methyltransferase YrrM
MLNEIISRVEAEIPNESFKDILERYRWQSNISSYMLNPAARYYKALAAYCRLYRPTRVLEIGCCSGASAVAMAQYTQVDTADLDFSSVCDQRIFAGSNITPIQLTAPDSCLSLPFDQYDLIFVDIDHSGAMESRLHKALGERYRGLAYWDDVALGDGMKAFWSEIGASQKKLLGWHWSGFGVTCYGTLGRHSG